MDPAKAKAEKLERERQLKLIREAAEAALKSRILAEENRLKIIQLKKSEKIFEFLEKRAKIFYEDETLKEKWEDIINCSPLPDLEKLNQINTHIQEWDIEIKRNDYNIKDIIEYTPQILQLIEKMKHFLELPPSSVSVGNLIETGIIYHKIKRLQTKFLDLSSYLFLTDLTNYFDPEIGIMEESWTSDSIKVSYWANLYSCPNYTGYEFQNMDFKFRIPEVLVETKGIYRLLKTEYDHYSDSTSSYFSPQNDSFLKKAAHNLFLTEDEIREQNIRFQADEEELLPRKSRKEDWERIGKRYKEIQKVETIEKLPTKEERGRKDMDGLRRKTEAELAKERERKEKKGLIPDLKPNELNLRSYRLLGGIFDFKLIEIPTQPKQPGYNLKYLIHILENEQRIHEVEFVSEYVAPPSYDIGEIKRTPEEMEREAKRQEEELQKLIQIDIKVPRRALWFEPPTVVRWDEENRLWSSDGFYDIRFHEDSLKLSFRTMKFGVIGLGHPRWGNLPYQSWEIIPIKQNSTRLSIMAAVVVIEFIIQDDLVCLSAIQNAANTDLVEENLLNKFMKPLQLIEALREVGLDVFPDYDSYAYVDGILVKDQDAEEHLYTCMAIASTSFNFHWSRWNLLAGRQKMVYQIRERHGAATPGNYQMVLNTPRSACLIDCTEVSPTYSEEPAGEYEADLLNLVLKMASVEGKDRLGSVSGEFVDAVRSILSSTKFISFA